MERRLGTVARDGWWWGAGMTSAGVSGQARGEALAAAAVAMSTASRCQHVCCNKASARAMQPAQGFADDAAAAVAPQPSITGRLQACHPARHACMQLRSVNTASKASRSNAAAASIHGGRPQGTYDALAKLPGSQSKGEHACNEAHPDLPRHVHRAGRVACWHGLHCCRNHVLCC